MQQDYDLAKIRAAMKAKQTGKRDPNEFIPPKVKQGQELNFRFYWLPPLDEGDTVASGVATKGMDGVFCVENGTHWANKRPISGCPRIMLQEDCAICNKGFELMGEIEGDSKEAKAAKSQIAKNYLPGQKFAANIYFPKDDVNPKELHGRVMWTNLGVTIYNLCEACLMRDNGGDELKPEAFGVFFDPSSAYLFNLTIKMGAGGFNNYESSQFLANVKRPIIATKQGDKIVPVLDKIEQVLNLRHDLFSKFESVNMKKIEAFMAAKEGASAGAGFDSDAPGVTAGVVVGDDLDGEGVTAGPVVPVAAPQPAKPAAPPVRTATPQTRRTSNYIEGIQGSYGKRTKELSIVPFSSPSHNAPNSK